MCESSCEKRERPGVKMRESESWRREKEGEFHRKKNHYDPYSLWGALGRV